VLLKHDLTKEDIKGREVIDDYIMFMIFIARGSRERI